jgi:predicted small lipoprotein YifL
MKAAPALTAIMIAISGSLVLAGCGQKGNLYLPNQKKKVPTTQTPAQPMPQPQPAPDAPSDAK